MNRMTWDEYQARFWQGTAGQASHFVEMGIEDWPSDYWMFDGLGSDELPRPVPVEMTDPYQVAGVIDSRGETPVFLASSVIPGNTPPALPTDQGVDGVTPVNVAVGGTNAADALAVARAQLVPEPEPAPEPEPEPEDTEPTE